MLKGEVSGFRLFEEQQQSLTKEQTSLTPSVVCLWDISLRHCKFLNVPN